MNGKMAPKRTLLSWSSGKDSAWCLQRLRQDAGYGVEGLFCTVNAEAGRVAMHATRLELLRAQAGRLGLPVEVIELPSPCPNVEYERIMGGFTERVAGEGVECLAFGDLFLEEVREYRVRNLRGSGLEAIFPLWGRPTAQLAREMIAGGVKAILTCVAPGQLAPEFVGRDFDAALLEALPPGVDPCGENGEFHTFVHDAPGFSSPIAVRLGERVLRGGFQFIDLLPG